MDDFTTSKLLYTLPWNSDVLSAVAFMGDLYVVAANRRGDILVWALPMSGEKGPEPVRRLVGHSGAVNRLLLGPDGKTAISASNDRTVKFWDLSASEGESGTIVLNDGYRFVGVTEKVEKLPPSPPPLTANVVAQKPIREFTAHKEWIWGLAISRDGKTLVTGDDARLVIVSEVQTAEEQCRWRVKQWIRSLAVSPDGRVVVTAEYLPHVRSEDCQPGLRGWDAKTGEMKFDASKGLPGPVSTVRFSDCGQHLACCVGPIDRDGVSGRLFMLDPATGEKVRELSPGHQRGAADLVFHPDGQHLVSCGRDRTVKFWRLSDGSLVHEIISTDKKDQFPPYFHAIAINAAGNLLAIADGFGQVLIYSIASAVRRTS
jgi:WD40 repeat protein